MSQRAVKIQFRAAWVDGEGRTVCSWPLNRFFTGLIPTPSQVMFYKGKVTFLGFISSKEKKKVNCKPKNQDEQEIPFRLREIMRSRQEMKKTLSNKKRKKEGMYSHRSFVCLYPDAQILRGV